MIEVTSRRVKYIKMGFFFILFYFFKTSFFSFRDLLNLLAIKFFTFDKIMQW